MKKEIEVKEVTSFKDINKPTSLGIAIDKENISYHKAELFGIAIAIENEVYYISKTNLLKDSTILEWLKDKNIQKYCYDYKAIKVILDRNNVTIEGLKFDLLLASYLLDSSLTNEEDAVFSYFNVSISRSEEMSLFSSTNTKRTGEIAYNSLAIAKTVTDELKVY